MISFAFKKYEILLEKFETNLFKYFHINQQKANHSTATSSLVMDTESISESPSASTSQKPVANKTPTKMSCSFYKEQLGLSILLLIYCAIRSLFIYDQLIVYKFTNDSLLLTSIMVEFISILAWFAGILLITVRTNWVFKLKKTYKIINWNWFYDYEVRPKFENGNKKIVNVTALGNGVENSVLYVRDDSVLNKSMDSSNSTTEVSYMPVIVSNTSSNTSNVSDSGASAGASNSFSSFSNNILDVNKLGQKYQILNQSEIEALYSKPQRNLTFDGVTDNTQKYDLVDTNQRYSRCLILSNEKIDTIKTNNVEESYQSTRIGQRSFSHRLPKTISLDANLTSQASFKRNFDQTTILAGNQKNHQQSSNLLSSEDAIVMNNIINHSKGNKSNTIAKSVLFVDSSSPTDSGRDSLNESPISSKQQPLQISNTNLNPILKIKPLTHLLDTNC